MKFTVNTCGMKTYIKENRTYGCDKCVEMSTDLNRRFSKRFRSRIAPACILFLMAPCLTAQSAAKHGGGPEQDATEAASRRATVTTPPAMPGMTPGVSKPYVDTTLPEEKHGPLSHKYALEMRIEGGGGREDVKPYWLDNCAYEPVYRLNRPFGTTPAWDYVPPPVEKTPTPRPEYRLGQTYRTRIGGLQRMNVLSADEMGRMLSESRVLDTIGGGNSQEENSLILKKYGLRRFVYAHGWTFIPTINDKRDQPPLPFLKAWEQTYRTFYEEVIYDYVNQLERLAETDGRNFLQDPETLYALFAYGDRMPSELFLRAVDVDYEAVAAEFKQESGCDLLMQDMLITPNQCATRIKFWLWVKRRYAEIIKLKSEVLRKRIPQGRIVGNIHFECWQDYERLAEGYDWVGTAVRPMLLAENDDLGRLYWMGYGVRLFGDLTDKPLMVSVRANQLGAGPRVVPSPSAITYWHNQAIQNGCVGFYIYLHEFPAYPGAYSGFCYGNPDMSTLPKIRWNTYMRLSRRLGQTKVFVPPKAETATLVSVATCALNDLGGWKRVLSSYIELCRAKVWSGFVSDQEIWEGSESLDQYKTIYIPAIVFEKEQVAMRLLEFVANGGTVVCADARAFSYNLDGEDTSHYCEKLFGLQAIQQRAKMGEEVSLAGDFAGISIHPYTPGYSLIPHQGTEVIGRYADSQAAAIMKRHGKGKALLFGAPILDMYSAGIRSFDDIKQQEDRARLTLYKRIEEQTGVADQSWVWDITVQNLRQVTGWVPYKPPAPDESIQFPEQQAEGLPDEG